MKNKLPEIYHDDSSVTSNNKKTYYSFKEKNVKKEEKNAQYFDASNFLQYLNKDVEIELTDNSIIKSKIISKLNNHVLLENGKELYLDTIKNIKLNKR